MNLITRASMVALMLSFGAWAAAQDRSTTQAQADDDLSSADIVVVGTAQGEKKALETKHDAPNFTEALYANDVGKLPDQNVAEAVRRLPGISVANDQGEGRYVIIRGVNPNRVNVVLNGLTLPAPEPDGRQVKLDDIPSAPTRRGRRPRCAPSRRSRTPVWRKSAPRSRDRAAAR